MDTSERALLETAVRDAFERAGPGVDGALAGLGWLEMLDAEPRDAIEVVFTALGATNAVASAVDDVVVTALGEKPRADLAVLLSPFGRWSPPGDSARAEGLLTSRVLNATELLLVADREGALDLIVVPVAAATVFAVNGVDPDSRLHVARVDVSAGSGARGIARTAWSDAVAAAQRALSHQISGACRTMLALACAHATERLQFGRPVARFQAVRHRLADALVAIEALDAALAAAWDEPGPMTAALAKLLAGRAATTVASHCQQVLAGIGFTTEHEFHRYLKRTMLLGGLFGTSDDLALSIGRALIESRSVPTLIDL